MKVPIALLRRLNVRLIIFLDDILIFAFSVAELNQARDTLIFLLQNLGFLINLKKSEFQPTQHIQFLGVEIDSVSMIVSLPQEKVQKIVCQCQQMLVKSETTLRELYSLVGRLSSTAIAVLPAPLQYRALQRQQIQELGKGKHFESLLTLSQGVKLELSWWVENLKLNNGKALVSSPPQLLMSSDASTQGWGAFCRGNKTGGPWTAQEKKLHINVLELKAAKLAILTFTKLFPKVKAIHLQMDNMAALSYIAKMGGGQRINCSQI